MNRFYSFLLASLLLVAFSLEVYAQGITTGKVNLGFTKSDDIIYESDGLSLDHNSKVGCAVLLTREMLAPYVGGTITGMLVGWDDKKSSAVYQGFVRSTFNGEDLTSGRLTAKFGWNTLTLKKYQIPEDVEQLVVGFTTNLKKDVCSIPMLYPHDVKHSCYLWVDGDNDVNGNPVWRDMCDRGALPILLVIQDTNGSFNYVPFITTIVSNGLVWAEEPSDCLLRIRNVGSQAIRSIEVTSRQGEQIYSKKVTLSSSIAAGTSSGSFLVPLYCFHSGDVVFSITKANDKEIAHPEEHVLKVLAMPSDMPEDYVHRPLVEYFESENNYRSARYYDEIVAPTLTDKLDKVTFVCQHLDDQFMTGDDDATALALALCDNDSSAVSIPAMTIDRCMSTDNIAFQQNIAFNPMFSVLYDPYGSQAFNAAMTHPTFVGVDVVGGWSEDGETVNVIVKGDVAAGVMPEGEQLRLTVYLMERQVFSDSQLFWTDKEKEEKKGEYVHTNVIREILSAADGDVVNGAGAIRAQYSTQVDPTWDKDHLYLVAFVHRDGQLGGKFMHVFNSAEGYIGDGSGIHDMNTSRVVDGHGSSTPIYDLSGRRVAKRADKGIYIVNGKKIVK